VYTKNCLIRNIIFVDHIRDQHTHFCDVLANCRNYWCFRIIINTIRRWLDDLLAGHQCTEQRPLRLTETR
jgi:hypothetical protein